MTDPRVEVDAGEALHAAWPLLDDDDNRGLDALLAHASPSPDGRRRVVLEERDGGVVVLGLEQATGSVVACPNQRCEGGEVWPKGTAGHAFALIPERCPTCNGDANVEATPTYALLPPVPASDPAMEEKP